MCLDKLVLKGNACQGLFDMWKIMLQSNVILILAILKFKQNNSA